ncbi:MAG TPA: hypothetical protein VHC49_25990 [Mycobacteriales bacterium]|nr:hypothetical protein [Mycobacteriales bacterium]
MKTAGILIGCLIATTTVVAGPTYAQAGPAPELVGTLRAPAADSGERATIRVLPSTDDPAAVRSDSVGRTVSATVGKSFALDVPDSWMKDGYANVVVTAQIGDRWTQWHAVADQGQTHSFTMGSDPALWVHAPSAEVAARSATGVSPDASCGGHTDSERATRIGEAHVAALSGMSVRFVYSVQEDTTTSVGAKVNGNHWSVDGSKKLSGSMGTSSSVAYGAGKVAYVNSHFMYRESWVPEYTCSDNDWMYSTYPISSIGDTFTGPNKPGTNPWHTCSRAPWHGTIEPVTGKYNKNKGEGTSYGVISNVFGFSFSGHTGWTANIRLEYANTNRTKRTFVCGVGKGPNDAHTIYNSLS